MRTDRWLVLFVMVLSMELVLNCSLPGKCKRAFLRRQGNIGDTFYLIINNSETNHF